MSTVNTGATKAVIKYYHERSVIQIKRIVVSLIAVAVRLGFGTAASAQQFEFQQNSKSVFFPSRGTQGEFILLSAQRSMTQVGDGTQSQSQSESEGLGGQFQLSLPLNRRLASAQGTLGPSTIRTTDFGFMRETEFESEEAN